MPELTYYLTTFADYGKLDHSPDGWDDNMIQFERQDIVKYTGVFRTFTMPLKFIKDGAYQLRTEVYTRGMNGRAMLEVYRLDKITLQYERKYKGYMELSSFKDYEDYVECNYVDGILEQIIKDRAGIEYQFQNSVISVWDTVNNIPGGWTTSGSFVKDSGTYHFLQWSEVATNLLNFMTDGGVLAGTYEFRSDFLETLEDLFVLCPGKQARYGVVNPTNPSGDFKTTFEDWFKSVNSIWCMGMAVEVNPVTGAQVLRVEPKSHFFTTWQGVDFGEVKSLSVSINNKLTFNRVKIGYEPKTYTHASLSVEEELNCTSNWTTENPISTQELDLTCKYRGDGSGFVDIILTEEDGNDDDIFIVQIYDNLGTLTMDERAEGQIVGVPASSFTAYNNAISPRRNLQRWNNFLSSCRFGLNTPLKFSSGDNYVAYQESDNGTGIMAGEYSNMTLLSGATFFPMQMDIEVAFPYNMINLIDADPSQLYQFQFEENNYLGYLVKVGVKLPGRDAQKIQMLAFGGTSFLNLIR